MGLNRISLNHLVQTQLISDDLWVGGLMRGDLFKA